jgi:hypothetical protein
MARKARRYFSRDYYRRIEKSLDVKAIVGCWAVNLSAAGIVFAVSWILFSNVFVTVLYTLSSWTITLTLSIVYWLSWIYNSLRTGGSVKMATSSVILTAYILGLVVIWETFVTIIRLTQMG